MADKDIAISSVTDMLNRSERGGSSGEVTMHRTGNLTEHFEGIHAKVSRAGEDVAPKTYGGVTASLRAWAAPRALVGASTAGAVAGLAIWLEPEVVKRKGEDRVSWVHVALWSVAAGLAAMVMVKRDTRG